MKEPPLVLDDVSYRYNATDTGGITGVNLHCEPRLWTAVMGPFGAGKSTLLYCASGLLSVSQGTIRVDKVDIASMGEAELTRERRDHIGFVFQNYNLIDAFTCLQNVMLSNLFGGRRMTLQAALGALDTMGLKEYADTYPSDLSGGQQQRVAIARALASKPDIIFADEPTGALDSRSSAMVLDSFEQAVREGRTVLMVTHDPNVAARAHRTVFLVDGRVESVCEGYDAERLAAHLAEMPSLIGGGEQ